MTLPTNCLPFPSPSILLRLSKIDEEEKVETPSSSLPTLSKICMNSLLLCVVSSPVGEREKGRENASHIKMNLKFQRSQASLPSKSSLVQMIPVSLKLIPPDRFSSARSETRLSPRSQAFQSLKESVTRQSSRADVGQETFY